MDPSFSNFQQGPSPPQQQQQQPPPQQQQGGQFQRQGQNQRNNAEQISAVENELSQLNPSQFPEACRLLEFGKLKHIVT